MSLSLPSSGNASAAPTPPLPASLALASLGIGLWSAGTLFNVSIFALLASYGSMRATSRLLFAALATADLVALNVRLCRLVLLLLSGMDLRDAGTWICRTHTALCFFAYDSSCCLAVLLAAERFMLVAYPTSGPVAADSWRHAALCVAAVELLCGAKAAPLLFLSFEGGRCQNYAPFLTSAPLMWLQQSLLFCVTFSTCAAWSGAFFRQMKRREARYKPAGKKSATGEFGPPRLPATFRRSSLQLVLVVLLISGVTNIPRHICSSLLIARVLSATPRVVFVYHTLLIWEMSNHVFNFCIYIATSRGFRSTFRALVSNGAAANNKDKIFYICEDGRFASAK